MKEILVRPEEFAMVDEIDYDLVMKYKWYISKGRNGKYARTVITENGKSKNILMHRLILGCVPKDGKVTDHKDGNGLNNQRDNIRICTMSENSKNRKPYGASKYLGVSLWRYKDKNRKNSKMRQKWKAAIKVGDKYLHLGLFENEELAAIAYNEAAKKYHGEFANLNVVQKDYAN